MNDETKTGLRLAAAVLFFGLGVWLLIRAPGAASLIVVAVVLMGAFAMWLVAAVLMAPTVAGWLAAPWGGLFFPSARNEKPPPHYSLAEAKMQRDDFEGALADYVKITLNYPGEVRPYCDMVDIVLRHLDDPERAEVIYRKGMETLEDQEAKEVLARHFRAAKSRAAARPDWGQVHTVRYREDEAAPGAYRDAPAREHVPNPMRTSKPKRDKTG